MRYRKFLVAVSSAKSLEYRAAENSLRSVGAVFTQQPFGHLASCLVLLMRDHHKNTLKDLNSLVRIELAFPQF
jgi:hypothetical protein